MAHSSVTDNTRLVLDTSVNEVPEALQVPTKAVSPGFQLLLSLANTAIWLSILPIGQILLPMQIAALNTASRFRNLAIATSVGVLAALSAVIPDQVPVRQRATVSAFVSLSLPLGAVIGALLVTKVVKATVLSYYTFGIVLVIVMLIFVLVLRDKPLPKGAAPRFHLGTFLAAFWVNPVKYPDFGWAWLTRFLVYLSYFIALGYLLYFLQDAVHYQKAAQGVTTFQIILTGTLLIASVLSGMLSDKFGRRKVFVMGASLVIALSFLILAFWQTWTGVQLAAAVLGIGFGAYLGVDIALITQVLPSANARGKDLGVINIANALPQVVGSATAALVITVSHSYTILFVLAALLASLGAVLIQQIKSVR